jgi:hypothetical protein
MLYKGYKKIVDKDYYYIIICEGELWLGFIPKGKYMGTSNDIWMFDNEEEQINKHNDLKK